MNDDKVRAAWAAVKVEPTLTLPQGSKGYTPIMVRFEDGHSENLDDILAELKCYRARQKVEPAASAPASGVDEVAALQKIGLDVVVLDWQPVDVIAPIPAAPKVEPVADGPASATDVEKMLDRLRDSVKGCPIPVTTIQVALVREAADMIERLVAKE